MRCKERFQKELNKLKTNTTSAPDAKKLKDSLLRGKLKDLVIRDTINCYGTDLDFLDNFGINAEDLQIWLEDHEEAVGNLEFAYDSLSVLGSHGGTNSEKN